MTPVATLDDCQTTKDGWGGNRPLPLVRMDVGGRVAECTAWVPTREELAMLANEGALLNLVVVKNEDGSLSYSMRVVVATLVSDDSFN